MAVEGLNIIIPHSENVLQGTSIPGVMAFTNVAELKGLLTTANGKIVDTPEITV